MRLWKTNVERNHNADVGKTDLVRSDSDFIVRQTVDVEMNTAK